MAWPTRLLINLAVFRTGGVADAFVSPTPHMNLPRPQRDVTPKGRYNTPSPSRLSLSKNANDNTELSVSDEMESIDMELAREVDEALSLAKNALTVEGEGAKVTVLKKVPKTNKSVEATPEKLSPMPEPPSDDPPDSFFSQLTPSGDEDTNTANNGPRPPESPPSANSVSFGETLQKAVSDEVERLKNLLFGLNQDLEETKFRAEEAEVAAENLKTEIEASKKEMEETVKLIEEQFVAEKESLAAQIGEASAQLDLILFESEQNITQIQAESSRIENELLERIDSFFNSIEQVSEKAKNANRDKEKLERAREQKINKIMEETKNNFLRYKATLDEEGENMKKYNIELQRQADAAENKVKAVYDNIQQIRTDRVQLQQKIQDVENNALEEISILERQMKVDNDYFANYLRDQKSKIDNLISMAKDKYESIVQGEKAKRESLENDFIEELNRRDKEGKGIISVIESKAKARLADLEKKHSKERIAIYQKKIEAVSAERKMMLDELAAENSKLEAIHTEMEGKLAGVRAELAQVQGEFQQELEKRRSMAEEERLAFMDEMDRIRTDMTAKMTDQQEMMEARRSDYLEEQNAIIAKSEEECRRAWVELANLNQQLNEAGEEKIELLNTVAKKTEKIELYEQERESFRKSLGLSLKLARQKIKSKTKRIVGKEEEKV